jgi:hypothetical protein
MATNARAGTSRHLYGTTNGGNGEVQAPATSDHIETLAKRLVILKGEVKIYSERLKGMRAEINKIEEVLKEENKPSKL